MVPGIGNRSRGAAGRPRGRAVDCPRPLRPHRSPKRPGAPRGTRGPRASSSPVGVDPQRPRVGVEAERELERAGRLGLAMLGLRAYAARLDAQRELRLPVRLEVGGAALPCPLVRRCGGRRRRCRRTRPAARGGSRARGRPRAGRSRRRAPSRGRTGRTRSAARSRGGGGEQALAAIVHVEPYPPVGGEVELAQELPLIARPRVSMSSRRCSAARPDSRHDEHRAGCRRRRSVRMPSSPVATAIASSSSVHVLRASAPTSAAIGAVDDRDPRRGTGSDPGPARRADRRRSRTRATESRHHTPRSARRPVRGGAAHVTRLARPAFVTISAQRTAGVIAAIS